MAANAASSRRLVLQWIGTAVAGILIFAAASAVFVGALWVVNEVVDAREIKIAAAFVFGLAFLLSIIAGIVAAFAAMKLTSAQTALGLPEGSIRAIIALVLVLIFVIMAVYLIEAVFTQETDAEARNAATQLLATLGTLVAAVSAFYFGTSAVTTGAAAVSQAAAAAGRAGPTAITKGSVLRADGYWLVGIVNPNGLETNWYFEYGREVGYGQHTPVASQGAGDAEIPLEVKVDDIEYDWHFRFVAFNDAGTSYGGDQVVTDKPRPPEGELEGEDGAEGPAGGEPEVGGVEGEVEADEGDQALRGESDEPVAPEDEAPPGDDPGGGDAEAADEEPAAEEAPSHPRPRRKK